MIPPFEEALENLIDEYWDKEPISDMISVLELKLMALREAEAEETA